jgi:hypothetical protein
MNEFEKMMRGLTRQIVKERDDLYLDIAAVCQRKRVIVEHG